MKNFYSILVLILLFSTQVAFSQNVGIGTNSPDPSAKLHIVDANRGLLIPNVSIGDVSLAAPVTTPATGLLVWNTNAAVTGGDGTGYYYWDGSQWVRLVSVNNDWRLEGNAGTNPTNNFVGTTDNVDLAFRTNNNEAVRIATNGNVGIGTTAPTAILHVNETNNNIAVPRRWFDGFEDGTLAPFTTTGNANWFTSNAAGEQNTGTFGASSGAITHNQSSSISITLTLGAAGTISFSKLVSSESCCDHLEFYIDGALQNQWGGEIGWSPESFAVTAGTHTFTWTYDKDGSVNTGNDKALIDDIAITNVDQTTNVAVRIVDGNEAVGKVLTSDANGNAFWEDVNNLTAPVEGDADWFISPGTTIPQSTNDIIYHMGGVIVGSTGNDGHHFDVDNGTATGTQVGVGSIEFITDQSSETTINNRFSPASDDLYDLGSATLRWDDVYATNGVIQTSDAREKEQIKPMAYGLKEIMKLRPVTYKWNKTKIGSTPLADEDKELKLGLIAQEVQQVLPEVVQTHNWRVLSEEEPDKYSKVPMRRLGMAYQEIIPVLIKAVQEQQTQLDESRQQIEALKAEVERLSK